MNKLSYATDLSKVNILDQQRAFTSIASAIGREYKLNFRLVDNGNDKKVCPYTTPKGEVVLPALRSDSTKSDVIDFWSSFWHEVGHHAPELAESFKFRSDLKLNAFSMHGIVMNIIEDTRVDFNKTDEFIGKQEAIEQGFSNVLKNIWDKKILANEPSGPLHMVAMGVILVDWAVRGTRSPTFQAAHDVYMQEDPTNSNLHPDVRAVADKILSDTSIMERYYDCFTMSAEEEWQLTKDILELLGMEEPNNGCSSGGSEDQGDSEDSDSGDGSQGAKGSNSDTNEDSSEDNGSSQGSGDSGSDVNGTGTSKSSKKGNGYKGNEYSEQDQVDASDLLKDKHTNDKSKGEEDSTNSEEDGDGNKKGKGKGTPGEKEAEAMEKKDNKITEENIPYTQESKSDNKVGNVNTDINIDYSSYRKGSVAKSYDTNVTVIDMSDVNSPKKLAGTHTYSFKSVCKHDGVSHRNTTIRKIVTNTIPAAHLIVNTARRKLQVFLRTRYLKNQRKGKLNGSSLFKIKTSKSKKPTIYKQRIKNKQDDCRISILIDNSGSMSGNRQISAYKAAIYLATLCTSLRIPYEVSYFADLYNECTYFITKAFTSPHISEAGQEKQMNILTDLMGSNSDGDYVKVAYDRLIKHGDEKRKVLFVVSDGQPASHRSDVDEVGLLKDTVQMIEADPKVDILGIGVQTDSVKDYYTNYKILKDSSELETCVIDLIVDSITSK